MRRPGHAHPACHRDDASTGGSAGARHDRRPRPRLLLLAQSFRRRCQRRPAARWRALACSVEDLAALESDWAELAAGQAGVHFDMGGDNLLITGGGQVLVCDWSWLALAAPWVDLAGLLVSVHGDGLDAEATLADHRLARGVEPRAISCLLSAMAGYFTQVAARAAFASSPWMGSSG